MMKGKKDFTLLLDVGFEPNNTTKFLASRSFTAASSV
jgi:hypothetical protein